MNVVDTTKDSKGYVEFYATPTEAGIPMLHTGHHRNGPNLGETLDGPVSIYNYDNPKRPVLLGAAGMFKGDEYFYRRTPCVVAERLRVAVPPGSHTFMIQRGGEVLRVSVEEGQVTPVEINYTVVHKAIGSVIYKVECLTHDAVPYKAPPRG